MVVARVIDHLPSDIHRAATENNSDSVMEVRDPKAFISSLSRWYGRSMNTPIHDSIEQHSADWFGATVKALYEKSDIEMMIRLLTTGNKINETPLSFM